MTIKIPAGPVTPHGVFHILKGDQPMVSLVSPNEQIKIWLMGGHSLPDPTNPEAILVESLKGLIAPWEMIDQQGANEDGVTFIDALYGPIEPELVVNLTARDAKNLRRVRRHLLEALDAKQQSELGWMTHELGYWWAPIRWNRTLIDAEAGAQNLRQRMTLALRADSGFWQSYPDLDEFGFSYEDVTDSFNAADYSDEENLGPNWPQYYTGNGGGYCYSNGQHARWQDTLSIFTNTTEVVNGPLADFETSTDNQVVSTVLGSVPEWGLEATGANDLWGRMGRDGGGDWDGNGIRVRITRHRIQLSAFVNFTEVWTRTKGVVFLPFPGDKWTLVCGYTNNARLFKVQRNGATVLEYVESGTQSLLGAGYRGVGFGMRAGGAILTQATPAIMRKISAGDNAEVSQTGFLTRHNAGDQPVHDAYTCYGPGIFSIANGPDSTDMVELGPLEAGEIAYIDTNPRSGGVYDYTQRTGNETAPVLFGANPTDRMYAKMRGRFTQACAIPPKEPGMRVRAYTIKVAITDGDPDSRITAQLTPLRRYPQ